MKNMFLIALLLGLVTAGHAKDKKNAGNEVKAACQVKIDSLSVALDDAKWQNRMLEKKVKDLTKQLAEAQAAKAKMLATDDASSIETKK